MFSLKRFGIGVKITAGLLFFLIILAVATSWLVVHGFSQAEQAAVQRVSENLQKKKDGKPDSDDFSRSTAFRCGIAARLLT